MMKGQTIGYIRVSTADQNISRQLVGIEMDKVFTDYCSGRSLDRPEFNKMLEYCREGDTIVIHSIDRLSRSVSDMTKTIKTFNTKGIVVKFIKENLTMTGDDSPQSKFLLHSLSCFAEFESGMIRERQKEGIAIAKAKGKYTGRKKSLSNAKIKTMKDRISSGASKASVAREFGISRETVYQYLKND